MKKDYVYICIIAILLIVSLTSISKTPVNDLYNGETGVYIDLSEEENSETSCVNQLDFIYQDLLNNLDGLDLSKSYLSVTCPHSEIHSQYRTDESDYISGSVKSVYLEVDPFNGIITNYFGDITLLDYLAAPTSFYQYAQWFEEFGNLDNIDLFYELNDDRYTQLVPGMDEMDEFSSKYPFYKVVEASSSDLIYYISSLYNQEDIPTLYPKYQIAITSDEVYLEELRNNNIIDTNNNLIINRTGSEKNQVDFDSSNLLEYFKQNNYYAAANFDGAVYINYIVFDDNKFEFFIFMVPENIYESNFENTFNWQYNSIKNLTTDDIIKPE